MQILIWIWDAHIDHNAFADHNRSSLFFFFGIKKYVENINRRVDRFPIDLAFKKKMFI